MPSQSQHDDLPAYQQPGLINFIADRLMARVRERRQAAAQAPVRVRNIGRRRRQQTEPETVPREREPRVPRSLPQDGLRYQQSDETQRQHDRYRSRPTD